MPKQGYITAASNHIRHLQMAVDLRLSLRDIDPEREFALVVDDAIAPQLTKFPGVFDHVFVIPEAVNIGHSSKVYTGRISPFEQTLFIDADCIVLDKLDGLWAALQAKDFCVPGEYVTKDDTRHHHNFQIAKLCEIFALESYYWASSPIYYFNDAGREVMNEIHAIYCEELPRSRITRWDTGTPPDEIAFAIVGSRLGFKEFPPIQTLIKQKDLASWTTGGHPHEIYHCTMCPRFSVLAQLMNAIARRRAAHQLPQGSRRYWVRKALYKLIQQKITKWLGLPWTFKLGQAT